MNIPLLDCFSTLSDPRHAYKIIYSQPEIFADDPMRYDGRLGRLGGNCALGA
jgi:hypothetical protein